MRPPRKMVVIGAGIAGLCTTPARAARMASVIVVFGRHHTDPVDDIAAAGDPPNEHAGEPRQNQS